ncbi:MAG: response regulator [Desulfobacteraceae bacterium]|jgi:DNA-binding response OmpR family regulator
MANILIVESYRSLGSLYREVLEEEGYTVFVTITGKEALELASAKNIDLAVVEEGLPDLSAEKLLEQLRQLQPNMQGTVCTVTDFNAESKEDLCDENILKTPDFTILQEKVKKLLQKSSTS